MIIKSVFRVDNSTVRIKVEMCAKEWHKAKAKGQLGQLYGIDMSNKIYHDTDVKAYHPTVDDSARAKNGLKSIVLYYRDEMWAPAPNNVVYVDFQLQRAVNNPVNFIPVPRESVELPAIDNVIKVDFVARRKAA